MITVLLADDQPLVRAGLRAVLDAEPDISVVGEVNDGLQAVRMAGSLRPDVVLMDVRMPNMDGIEATRRITASVDDARVVVVTTFDVDEYVYSALKAGASGFLLKDCTPDELARAVRTVAEGNALLAPSVTRRVITHFARKAATTPPESLATLSAREHEVLLLVGEGLNNAEIAARLSLGEATVKTHLSHLLDKLELRDRIQAVVLVHEAGLNETTSG